MKETIPCSGKHFAGIIAVLGSLMVVFLLHSCATPVSPTGGPSDDEGPRVVHSDPETGTTNFDGRTITIKFDEFVERGNFEQALDIEPEIDVDYEIKWRRKTVRVEFEEDLPEETTVILNLGTDLTDTNNNQIGDPIKIAFSTGPEIDSGVLLARLVDARTGESGEGQRIMLYRDSLDFDRPANYVAETDTGGYAEFEYLADGTYYAFWLDDRNRNKIWDEDQERAQPFGQEMIDLEKEEEDTLGTVFIAQSDTTPPDLQGVGLYSDQRMRLRFSESIELTGQTELSIEDSLGEAYSTADPLYIEPADSYILFAQSEEPLEENGSYVLNINEIEDEAGNRSQNIEQEFDGSSQEDTTLQRIVRQEQPAGILANEPLRLVFANPITEEMITDSIRVQQGDSAIAQWPHFEVSQNRLEIQPDEEWAENTDYEVRVFNPAWEDFEAIPLNVWYEDDLGGIQFTNADTTDSTEYNLILENEERGVVVDTTYTQEIELEGILPLQHKVTIYADQNENGRWDYGSLNPYEAPEPYFIRSDLPVEEAFTSEVTVEFD